MGHRWPTADPSLRDLEVEAEVSRAIDATQALRAWRDGVGAAPGARVPARLDAAGYERVAEHVARLARFEFSANGDEPVATVGVPGGSVLVMASEAVDLEAEKRRAAERAGVAAQGDHARRGQARQPGLRRQGARGRRHRRSARSWRSSSGSWTSCRDERWDLGRAEEHLLSLELFGMRFGLERMRRLLTALGSPQERFRAVHVVGTNGKSSTVRFTAALLEAHGVRTGSYLSPHLTTLRRAHPDRRRATSPAPSSAPRCSAPRRPRRKVDRTSPDGERVTQFELLTAAAFDEFARRGVEVAVVEAGLGGRYDATNVLGAEVVVLTNVGLEHTRWLGPTIADIAGEKLAVVSPRRDARARRRRARGGRAGRGDRRARSCVPEPVEIDLPGYQRTNFAAAAAAASAILGRPATIFPSGLSVPGRLQSSTTTR